METLTTQPTLVLEHLREKAYRAYSGTSFSPEKRAQSIVNDYSQELQADLVEVNNDEQYKTKYISLLSSWLGAKANCLSTMIAGPANFPVRRAEKANKSEENRYKEFREWRERALKAIKKAAEPEKTIETELERLTVELEAMKVNHELMKEGNKRIKQAVKDMVNIDAYLTETFGIQPHMLEFTMKFGFGLTNSNAKIKRIEERIKELTAKSELKTRENKEYVLDGLKVIYNYEVDRIQIKHDSKPEYSVIQDLKKSGFKWSPSHGVWQRQLTNNAVDSVRSLLKKWGIDISKG